jgi:hypothetical protein
MKRRLVLRDTKSRDIASAFIASLPVSADMPLEVIVATYRKRRSLAQNNCLHGWMQAIANAYEESHGDRIPPAAWKEYFKGLFLGEQSVEVMGKIVTTTRSTSDLPVVEFRDMLDAIDRWAVEHLFLSLPRGPEYDEAMGS